MSNVVATQQVADACVRARVRRLVVASSSSVYGDSGRGLLSENGPARPSSPYGVTKLAAERLCLAHAERPDSVTSVVALRYFTVYGPRQRDDMLIHRLLRAALDGTEVRIYGDGSKRRDFTYVTDAVAATVAAGRAAVTGARGRQRGRRAGHDLGPQRGHGRRADHGTAGATPPCARRSR
jgi:UDP-glucuronate 4-epimerase